MMNQTDITLNTSSNTSSNNLPTAAADSALAAAPNAAADTSATAETAATDAADAPVRHKTIAPLSARVAVMTLTLRRIAKRPDYTIGRLTDEHGRRICDTLEPTWRDLLGGRGHKVAGRTAVPEGRYQIIVTRSPRFKEWLPLLLQVPQFSGIRIHAGNTAADTAGCILVGENTQVGRLTDSRKALQRLMRLLDEAMRFGRRIFIRIV